MTRVRLAALLALAFIAPAIAQDGPLRRAGRNIRERVEVEQARAQISSQERDILYRVSKRIEWDKLLAGSTVQISVQPGGSVVLKGSVANDAAKLRAVDLVENTTGVATVVDELAVVRAVKVIEARPTTVTTPTVIESRPVVVETAPVVVPSPPVESGVIIKP